MTFFSNLWDHKMGNQTHAVLPPSTECEELLKSQHGQRALEQRWISKEHFTSSAPTHDTIARLHLLLDEVGMFAFEKGYFQGKNIATMPLSELEQIHKQARENMPDIASLPTVQHYL